jgi:uncharacterized MnhB-related membrane protein
VVVLTVVMLVGVSVVLSYDARRQVFTFAVFGLSLALLFVVLQAPDVALSELTVGTIVVPLVLLVAIRQTRDESRDETEQ